MNEPATRIDVLAAAGDPAVRALDLSMFGRGDLVNLILQRSEVLADSRQGQRPVRAWIDGDSGPILAEVDRLGEDIARRAAGVILAEYRATRAAVLAAAPKRIADIGCGYAIWDLFAARDTGADIVLIDLEGNDRRHFGFADEGAAYSSLAVARDFMTANGVAAESLTCLNPGRDDLGQAGDVDLAVSFISCGFHYPVDAYLDFFRDRVRPGGAILLDLRRGTAKGQIGKLSALGQVAEELPSAHKARRILLRKEARG